MHRLTLLILPFTISCGIGSTDPPASASASHALDERVTGTPPSVDYRPELDGVPVTNPSESRPRLSLAEAKSASNARARATVARLSGLAETVAIVSPFGGTDVEEEHTFHTAVGPELVTCRYVAATVVESLRGQLPRIVEIHTRATSEGLTLSSASDAIVFLSNSGRLLGGYRLSGDRLSLGHEKVSLDEFRGML